MTLSITGISHDVVNRRGGDKITLTGSFDIDDPYAVYMGTTGTASDQQCYSGVSGEGYDAKSADGTTLEFVVPWFPIGTTTPLVVFVVKGVETDTAELGIRGGNFGNLVHVTRKNFPPWTGLGNRRLELEPREGHSFGVPIEEADDGLPTMIRVDSNTWTVQGKLGNVAPLLRYRFQDNRVRAFDPVGVTWDVREMGELGLDGGGPADEASTWYFLYLVPSAANDAVLTVIGSKISPAAGGPLGYSNRLYVGAAYNNGSQNFWEMKLLNDDWWMFFGNSELGVTVNWVTGYTPPAVDTWYAFSGGSAMSVALPAGVADAGMFECGLDSDAPSGQVGLHQIQIANGEGGVPLVTPVGGFGYSCTVTQNNSRDANTVVRLLGEDPTMYRSHMSANNPPVDFRVRLIGWHDGYRAR